MQAFGAVLIESDIRTESPPRAFQRRSEPSYLSIGNVQGIIRSACWSDTIQLGLKGTA
ncbi:hypothetical protein AURDEDRAFT_164060 [Auricularia subglabra TFB-10046 SS5]|nr:hypothetical protein AURDEDRAFT_164060 [Auricularia subglabra TFB-10046 SS5]